jgi:hypothetical protein
MKTTSLYARVFPGGTQSQGVHSAGVLQVNKATTPGGTLAVSLGAGAQIGPGDMITILASTGTLSEHSGPQLSET